MRRWPIVAAITLGAATAAAHVAPSVDDNNRYLKLTPQRDRVRLAYTVFFGENPGHSMRPGLDADRDGAISDAEAQAFADKLGREVAAALAVTVDGGGQQVAWAEAVPGLGTPSVRGGSFSIDLIAYLCVDPSRPRHELRLRDRFRLLRPGETEVKVEGLPGVRIDRARIGPADDPTHDFKFVGPGGPLADDGLELAYEASDQAPSGAGTCGGGRAAASPAAGARSSSSLPAIAIAVIAGLALAAAGWWRYRRAAKGRPDCCG